MKRKQRFEEAYLEVTGKKFDWSGGDRLLSIFDGSIALSEKLIRNPSWADNFNLSWDRQKTAKDIQDELKGMVESAGPDDIAGWQKLLRHFKYQQMIRIVARDLDAPPPVKDILLEWSDVADAVIAAAYDAALKMLQFGGPSQCTGTIIALGKLGGRELNMSSDVDLLCLYASDNGGTPSNHEFFTKVVTLLTQVLSAITEDGFAYRCDHDLRPEGSKGPLVNSIDAAERYYETFGQDWERQALIRARPVAGDIALGQNFIEVITPFIYRRSLSFDDLSHLKDMKRRMEGKTEDIKLGRGGIRELEFLIQCFQQVFGGHIKAIRTPNTFDAIDALKRQNLIHPHGAETLKNAYAFLRRTENMIQIVNDRQTHVLPHAAKEVSELARRMNTTDFVSEWRRHSRLVHRLFIGLFEADYDRLELEEAICANLATCNTDEERIDSLSWFKHQEIRRLSHLDLNSKISLPDLLRRLTLVAEVVLHTAWGLALKSLMRRYGEPQLPNGARAQFAIIGFGRLGSSEIDYGSDLDLCFLYSGDGKTSGPEVITNSEFFTKLSQRIISLVCLHSRYGRAYQIDSELRPSGRQGSLVATLESFRDYHTREAKLWERQALLKTRVVAGDEPFTKEVKIALTGIAYKAPVPDDQTIRIEIADLRRRFEVEAGREKDGTYNLKIGPGGIADIEAVIQYMQLKNATKHPKLWAQNGFEILKVLHHINVLTDDLYDELLASYHFYRQLISRLRLFSHSATDLLDFHAPYIGSLGGTLRFTSPDMLKTELERIRGTVRALYNSFFS